MTMSKKDEQQHGRQAWFNSTENRRQLLEQRRAKLEGEAKRLERRGGGGGDGDGRRR